MRPFQVTTRGFPHPTAFRLTWRNPDPAAVQDIRKARIAPENMP
jgi:hypothetical protein